MEEGKEENGARQAPMRRNPALETLLSELNTVLAPAQSALTVDVRDRSAKVFLVGAMRSGTTLFMQWLANSGLFSYPTNLMSRFYAAPLLGAKIQQLLTDPAFDFKGELTRTQSGINYASDNGKTVGPGSPNEFWYFWRRHLPALADGYADENAIRATGDLDGLRDAINGLSNLFEQPLAMKALILNQHVQLLAGLFERPLLTWIRRDPALNIQSVLEARVRQYGNVDTWYSFRIKEYPFLASLDPLHAVAGQVFAINASLEQAFAGLPARHRMIVDYEAFCQNPASIHEELMDRVHSLGGDIPFKRCCYMGPGTFPESRDWRLTTCSRSKAEAAYREMSVRMT